MAEIPEHLLKRAQARKAALSGQPVAESSSSESETAAKTIAGSVAGGALETAPGTSPGTGGPPAGTGVAAISGDASEAPQPRNPENHLPRWVWPFVLVVPLVAILYVGAFSDQTEAHAPTDPVALGEQLYASNCASCHGASGQGGVGRALANGEVLLTFPESYTDSSGKTVEGIELQKAWIRGGSTTGLGYGDPNREGGQRISKGGMPAFGGTLTEAQIDAVVLYVRTKLK